MNQIHIRELGQQDYQKTLDAMRQFTDMRTEKTPDEIWLLEHPPVFTQGQAGRAEHILHPGDIPVIQSDRGGQITYHGPGQLVAYILLDLKRANLGIRALVSLLENAVIKLLATYDIVATAKANAPGVYVDNAKICSIGLRLRKGYSYHGIALNIDMDMEPFTRINPCGFERLKMMQINELIKAPVNINSVKNQLTTILCELLDTQFKQLP